VPQRILHLLGSNVKNCLIELFLAAFIAIGADYLAALLVNLQELRLILEA
jgi:hypothetical protein